MRREQQKRISLVTHVSCAVVLCTTFVAWENWVLHSVEVSQIETNAKVAELVNQLQNVPKFESQLNSLKLDLQDRENKSRAIKDLIPAQLDDAGFIENVSKIAQQTGVQIKDFRRGKNQHQSELSLLSLGIECESEYENLCKFVAAIESIPQITGVEKLSIESVANSNRLSINLDLFLYYGLTSKTKSKEV